MCYDFYKMKGSGRKLYKKMWSGTEFCSKDFIANRNWTGEESDASFWINTPNASKLFAEIIPVLGSDLADKFGLENREVFKEKLSEACSGSGQEALKITTMHSSSLCALLFFYNVCDKNKLELELGDGENKKTYIFEQSYFEFQNVVIKGRQPSNMDVVLIGYEKDDISQAVVLFLESKFSEYYKKPKKHLDIASSYLENNYGGVVYKNLEPKYKIDIENSPKNNFRLIAADATYMEGIKQMISHYIGVRNLLDRKVVSKRNSVGHGNVVDAVNKGAKVFLGSIIFADLFSSAKDREAYYENYAAKYKELAKLLNSVSNMPKPDKGIGNTERLMVLENPLTYTEVFNRGSSNFLVDEKVKKYYFGKEENEKVVVDSDDK